MSQISIDIESQTSQSALQTNPEPSSGVELATPASQASSYQEDIPVAPHTQNSPRTRKSPCNKGFWFFIIMSLLLAGILSTCSWQFHVLEGQASEIKSHYIETMEQIVTVDATSCGKSFGIGFLTDNQPPILVTTRTLTFSCPINQCSCDSYADQWISNQSLKRVYYVDTDPTNFDTSYPKPFEAQINGYLVGIIISVMLLFLSLLGICQTKY